MKIKEILKVLELEKKKGYNDTSTTVSLYTFLTRNLLENLLPKELWLYLKQYRKLDHTKRKEFIERLSMYLSKQRGESINKRKIENLDKTRSADENITIDKENASKKKENTDVNLEDLAIPIKGIKGIGQKRSELLLKLGISTISDILQFYPRKYDDRRKITKIALLMFNKKETVIVQVVYQDFAIVKQGRILKIGVRDETGEAEMICFNRNFLKDILIPGDKIVLTGIFEKKSKITIANFEFEKLDNKLSKLHYKRIVPIYSLTRGIKQKFLREFIYSILKENYRSIIEIIPSDILKKRNLIGITEALRNIHFPKNFTNLEEAVKYLKYRELFIYQLLILLLRKKALAIKRDFIYKKFKHYQELIPFISFELTEDQEKTLSDIKRDLLSPSPMRRLIQGDVGSGKTIVALISMLWCVNNGGQAVLMAPTEVLAEQHYINIKSLVHGQNINIDLLKGGLSSKVKDIVYKRIEQGISNIIIGTHALIQETVNFKNLRYVVIDEQHRFGVKQRELLKKKGYNPDILVMTATPIPRSLALTIYGDLDISFIYSMPAGRKPIKTIIFSEYDLEKAIEMVYSKLSAGQQGYIVFPLIDDNETEVKALYSAYSKWKKSFFMKYRCGYLHGRMLSEEKQQIMKDFNKGKYDILFSTTVIEVGIDVKNASFIIIVNAERFGLSQLHQIRGRVGRGKYEAICLLIHSKEISNEGKKRLKIIEKNNSGFKIAEEDMKMRGPGEILGTRQSGLPQFRIVNITTDYALIEKVRIDINTLELDLIIKDKNIQKTLSILKNKINFSVSIS